MNSFRIFKQKIPNGRKRFLNWRRNTGSNRGQCALLKVEKSTFLEGRSTSLVRMTHGPSSKSKNKYMMPKWKSKGKLKGNDRKERQNGLKDVNRNLPSSREAS